MPIKIFLNKNYRAPKSLSKKLNAFESLLSTKFGETQNIIDLLNKELPEDLQQNQPSFSKLIGIYKKQKLNYINKNSEATLRQILDVADKLVKKYFGEDYEYDLKRGKYEPLYRKKKIITNPDRLKELIGAWKAYAWDQRQSHNSEEKYLFIFKANIFSRDKIICETDHTVFEKNKMSIVHDRLVIELLDKQYTRKVFLVAYLGNPNPGYLKDLPFMFMTYVDTGIRKVKSGVALIERVSHDEYHKLSPYTTKLSEFKDSARYNELKKLQDSQFIID